MPAIYCWATAERESIGRILVLRQDAATGVDVSGVAAVAGAAALLPLLPCVPQAASSSNPRKRSVRAMICRAWLLEFSLLACPARCVRFHIPPRCRMQSLRL